VIGQGLEVMLRVGVNFKQVEEDVPIDQKLCQLLKGLDLNPLLLLAVRNHVDAVELAGLVGEQSNQLL